MADNLRITTPVVGNENINRMRPSQDPTVVETIDPSKVSSRNANDQTDQKGNLNLAFNSSSVYQRFIDRLSQTPELAQTLMKLLSGTVAGKAEAGQEASPLQQLLQRFLGNMEMDKAQMLTNLLFQQEHSTRFNGELFTVLRQLASNEAPPELEAALGRFLKAYDSYFSMGSTMNTVLKELTHLLPYIPATYRAEIEEQVKMLYAGTTEPEIAANLKVLKENILPLLSRYVSRTNDFGETRDRIALLVHDLSRLNVSSREEVIGSFEELLEHCRYQLNLTGDKIEHLQGLFIQKLMGAEKQENAFIDALIRVLASPSRMELSGASGSLVRDTISTLLLDQSVYMPFNHFILPVVYQGAFLFSELWVEKDGGQGSDGEEGGEQTRRMYLSFDVENLGSFQAVLLLTGDKVDFQIQYPQSLSEKDEDIRNELAQIFTRNGFTPQNIVSASELPGVKSDIMKKVRERRHTIDVTV